MLNDLDHEACKDKPWDRLAEEPSCSRNILSFSPASG
jgi:hypothetical protein